MVVLSIEEVQPRAQAALESSPFHELREVRVQRRGESLLISGTVSSFYHKQVAQEVVRSVGKGIELINDILVR
jgi:hypothetical protein